MFGGIMIKMKLVWKLIKLSRLLVKKWKLLKITMKIEFSLEALDRDVNLH